MPEYAIKTRELGKMYKLFSTPGDKILDAFGVLNWFPWKKQPYHEFWALQDITIEVARGEQVGIIGSNGAGKSTLLKLITGNISPTSGSVEVHGAIQALMDLGSGFHPEFSGYENIRASLAYQGFSPDRIKEAVREIAEFTELGQFLDQPVKTYSAGMLARLSFTTSTVIEPEILIIDEILGAGDAYFISKSKDRMRKLIDSGASILLVSHALDQITQFCEEAIWIERGRLVQRGPSMEVVKAYEQFVRIRTERRLKAINYKRQSGHTSAAQLDQYGDTLVLRYVLDGNPGTQCDISEITLLKDDEAEERISVGDVQDSSGYHQAFVQLEGGDWSKPQKKNDALFRSLTVPLIGLRGASGNAIFSLFALYDNADYTVETTCRLNGPGELHIEVWRNGVLVSNIPCITEPADWTRSLITVADAQKVSVPSVTEPERRDSDTGKGEHLPSEKTEKTTEVRRWPGEGSLMIENVAMFDDAGNDTTIFQAGSHLNIKITFLAHTSKVFEVLPTIFIYRLDGILVTKCPDNEQSQSIFLESGQTSSIFFTIGPLTLGDGHYIFSVGLFKSVYEESQRYDVIDRSFEFQITGNKKIMAQTICHVPGMWELKSDT